MFIKRQSLLVLFAATSMLSLSTVQAATSAPANFNVLILIKPKCTITTSAIDDIDLGAHDTTDTNVTGSTTFNVLCTKRTPYNIAMKPSNGNTSGLGNMTGATADNTDKIAYQLRQSTASGSVWGSEEGTNTLTNTVIADGATPTLYTVFATVPTIGNVLPDNYKDVVTVTVNY